MWIEITDVHGNTIGAVNSECCDLIRIDAADPKKSMGGALIRSASSGDADGADIYKTKVSYLRLIETLTQSEIRGIQQIAEIVGAVEERDAPRLILP